MNKKILFGAIAAAVVALNVAVLASTAVALPPEPPVTNGCFQIYSYCKDGATLVLRPNCTFNMNTNKRCKQHFCEECFPPLIEEPIIFRDFDKDPFRP